MSVHVDFPWREEPAVLVLAFRSASLAQVYVPAVVFPLFRNSVIAPEVAADLLALTGSRRHPNGGISARIATQGEEMGRLTFRIARHANLVRLEHGRARSQILLGFDFLNLFRETRLRFDGANAHLTLDTTTSAG